MALPRGFCRKVALAYNLKGLKLPSFSSRARVESATGVLTTKRKEKVSGKALVQILSLSFIVTRIKVTFDASRIASQR